MNFRTQITISKTNHPIDYTSKLLLFGSCFSENIGQKFDYFRFQNTINPFGILFHPIAIQNSIVRAINQKIFTEKDLFFHNEQWHCYDVHSALSNASKEVLLDKLNTQQEFTLKKLKDASHLIITLGTAWVYELIETQQIVANCHKVPQKAFVKKLLSIDEITTSLTTIISALQSINPKIQLLFTVSPIRHLKDGMIENNVSKAHLLASVHQLVSATENTSYFPSYEIVQDDLRDYRFYKADLIHPNKTAVEYIWELFKNSWLKDSCHPILKEITTIQNGLAHKPFNEESEAHQQFLKKLAQKKNALKSKFNITF